MTPDIASALAGHWVGRPRIVTIDLDIELEFSGNADGTVQGKLIGTNLGKIDKPLRDFAMGTPAGRGGAPAGPNNPRRMGFQLPNTQPWTFAGELSADGSAITGVLNSAQGGVPVTFRKR